MDAYGPIAPFYDCEHADFREDIPFYLQLIASGPVLEVGSGTGRLTGSLAAAGFPVWGVEPSGAMMERARRHLSHHPQVHLIQGRIQDVQLDLKFAAALLPLNTLWHFTDAADQVEALSAIHRHLKPEGKLVVDLSNPLTMADRGARGELRQRFDRTCDGQRVTGYSAAWDDEAEQTLALDLIYDVLAGDGSIRRSRAYLSLRYTYRFELELLLRLAGFSVDGVYGSYDLDPYASDSPNLIVLARAAGDRGVRHDRAAAG